MYIIKIKIPQKGDKHKNECILSKTQLNQHMVHGIQNNSPHGHGENRSTLNRYPWPPWDPDLFSKVSNLWSDGATTRIFLTFVNLLLAGNKECYTIMRIIYTRENSELDDPWMTFVYFLLCYGLSIVCKFLFLRQLNRSEEKRKQWFFASCSDKVVLRVTEYPLAHVNIKIKYHHNINS